jgi:hypothetical protein
MGNDMMSILKRTKKENGPISSKLLPVLLDNNLEVKYPFYDKSQFHHLLHLEKKRTDRSQKPFILLLFDVSALIDEHFEEEILVNIKYALSSSLRESDLSGWFEYNKIIGVICADITVINAKTVERIITKIHSRFCEKLNQDVVQKINLTFHTYPDNTNHFSVNYPFNVSRYPDVANLAPYTDYDYPPRKGH